MHEHVHAAAPCAGMATELIAGGGDVLRLGVSCFFSAD
jgi:hypothetical protein